MGTFHLKSHPLSKEYGIPSLSMEDGPQGTADGVTHTTDWPSALTVAQTFDIDAFYLFAKSCANEQRLRGTGVMLGPMVNLARVPQGGRNFESLGEDPFLSSRLVEASVKGIQSEHVMACVKHYIDNNQETNRTATSATIDMATQYDLYLQPFIAAVRAGVLSVMCSYNKINGDWVSVVWFPPLFFVLLLPHFALNQQACENSQTLGYLKKQAGYKYFVVSDWGATHSTVKAALAGLDVEMPDSKYFGDALLQAVQSGQVPVSVIDDKVTRILSAMDAIGFLDKPPTGNLTVPTVSSANNAVARFLATRSAVLLQNNNHLLPWQVPQQGGVFTIGVIGDFANKSELVSGGGSGHVNADYVVSALQGIMNKVQKSSTVRVLYATSDLTQAKSVAAESNVCLVVVAAFSTEGADRSTLSLGPDEEALIAAVASNSNNVTVVINGPGAITTPWKSSVSSILAMGYPGQEFGNALADIVFGVENPSGRLAVTWPQNDSQSLPATSQWPGQDNVAQYSEKLLIGYRLYTSKQMTPNFPFGHGLSYTTFSYSHFSVLHHVFKNGIELKCHVTNTGPVAGAEVVQLYISYPQKYQQPVIQLKGFSRVVIKPNETVPVSLWILFDRGDLDLWNGSAPARATGVFT